MNNKIIENVGKLRFPITIVAIIWVVELFEWLSGYNFSKYGIFPREWDGLIGIFTAPYLHSGIEHLWSNTVPLFVLTTMIVFFYKRVAVASFIIIQLLTGFAVWLFARQSYHIGASGVVYGLVAFVFWSGIFRKKIRSIVLALIVVLIYHGYFYGIVPNKEGVSWESHLFGGLVGIFTAFLFKDLKEPEEMIKDPWADEEEPQTYFLPRDAFEQTKIERERERMLRERGWESDSTFFL